MLTRRCHDKIIIIIYYHYIPYQFLNGNLEYSTRDMMSCYLSVDLSGNPNTFIKLINKKLPQKNIRMCIQLCVLQIAALYSQFVLYRYAKKSFALHCKCVVEHLIMNSLIVVMISCPTSSIRHLFKSVTDCFFICHAHKYCIIARKLIHTINFYLVTTLISFSFFLEGLSKSQTILSAYTFFQLLHFLSCDNFTCERSTDLQRTDIMCGTRR